MKQLSQGWQYTVYDLENGRVRKIKHSPLLQYFIILFQSYLRPLLAYKQQRKVNLREKVSTTYIKKILSQKNAYLFGNPVFITTSDYEQDKVNLIAPILKKESLELSKKIIDDYCATVHTTWKYAFSDCVFNFDRNSGIDKEGRLVQIDFGELAVTKKDVEDMIQNKKWLTVSSPLKR